MLINANEWNFLDELMINVLDDSPLLNSLDENPHITALADLMGEQITKFGSHGPTAKL